jgi:hypothetical protein
MLEQDLITSLVQAEKGRRMRRRREKLPQIPI